MDDLKIIELTEEQDEELKKGFMENLSSALKINKEIQQLNDIEQNVIIIKETIPYLENIYSNPNRSIVDEEEIVKIELARRVTSESVKHLAKHTNDIQQIVPDIQPSKILNINKEESFFTYENKVIYTLIQNIKYCLKDMKQTLKIMSEIKTMNNEDIKYTAVTKSEHEEIQINLAISTKLNIQGVQQKINAYIANIKEIETQIEELTRFDAYKVIEKRHIQLIKPPVKKTNLILKNVNFNYAMNLWDHLNMIEDIKKARETERVNNQEETITENSKEEENLKKLLNEISFMSYVALLNKDSEDINKKKRKQKQKMSLSNEDINKIIINKVTNGKFNSATAEKQVRLIYSKYFDEYLDKIKGKKNAKKNK